MKDVKDVGEVSQSEINKAIEDISQSSYSQQNRVPLIKGEYRKEMFLKLKDLFLQELYKAVKEEEEVCKQTGVEPQMTGDNLKMVEALVDTAPNWFCLEALYEFLFKDNIIPTVQQMVERAVKLNQNLGNLQN